MAFLECNSVGNKSIKETADASKALLQLAKESKEQNDKLKYLKHYSYNFHSHHGHSCNYRFIPQLFITPNKHFTHKTKKSKIKYELIKNMKTTEFSIIITQDEDGYYLGRVPSLPGCHTQAKNLNTLYKRMEEAIQLWLEVKAVKKKELKIDRFVGLHQVAVTV